MKAQDIDKFLDEAYFKAEYELMFQKTAGNRELFLTLWNIIKENPKGKTWRLLWIMEHATEKDNSLIFEILDELHDLVLNTNNDSYRRIGLKMTLRCPLQEGHIGLMLDKCIEWINNPKVKVGTRALAFEYFSRTCQRYPEMAPEMIAIIDEQMERSPSAGLKSRMKQIKKQLM
jgi:hypothetical protein